MSVQLSVVSAAFAGMLMQMIGGFPARPVLWPAVAAGTARIIGVAVQMIFMLGDRAGGIAPARGPGGGR